MLLATLIKRIVVYGVMVFVVYLGARFYTTYTLAEKVSVCGARYGIPQHLDKSALTRKDFLASAKSWRCVKRDQNFLEALFFKIPDSWIDPPRPYVDPPFAVEELTDDVVVDQNISEDIRALAKSYEGESDRFNRIMGLLVASDKTKLGTREVGQRYGEVSVELTSIAARLSRVQPRTREVDELHQIFLKSIKRIASDGHEIKLLFISTSRDLEEGDAILALPKNALAENKSRLLDLRNRLMWAEGEIQTKLDSLEQSKKTAMRALNGLDRLARNYGASLTTSTN